MGQRRREAPRLALVIPAEADDQDAAGL